MLPSFLSLKLLQTKFEACAIVISYLDICSDVIIAIQMVFAVPLDRNINSMFAFKNKLDLICVFRFVRA